MKKEKIWDVFECIALILALVGMFVFAFFGYKIGYDNGQADGYREGQLAVVEQVNDVCDEYEEDEIRYYQTDVGYMFKVTRVY